MPERVETQGTAGSARSQEPPRKKRLWIHGVLFVATCGTTFFAGGVSYDESGAHFAPMEGLLFSISIIGILLVHEMGHYFAARRHSVEASLPYFIPVPLPPVGTFGAIIKMEKPPRTRSSLLDIGSAGPLAGLVVTIVVCYVGLRLSEIRPISDLPKNAWMEGNSLLYLALKKLAHPQMGPGYDVWLHPVAWAGWLGILVTSLNLLPVGQLDGGHVMYSLAGPRFHSRLGKFTHGMVFLMGLIGITCYLLLLHGPTMATLKEIGLAHWVTRGSGMLVWLVWTILLRFVGTSHPPIEDPDQSLGNGRLVTGVLTMLVLVLTFTPVIGSPLSP
jgi:membrane-associated protease RseP (regulator of RpoE activity)